VIEIAILAIVVAIAAAWLTWNARPADGNRKQDPRCWPAYSWGAVVAAGGLVLALDANRAALVWTSLGIWIAAGIAEIVLWLVHLRRSGAWPITGATVSVLAAIWGWTMTGSGNVAADSYNPWIHDHRILLAIILPGLLAATTSLSRVWSSRTSLRRLIGWTCLIGIQVAVTVVVVAMQLLVPVPFTSGHKMLPTLSREPGIFSLGSLLVPAGFVLMGLAWTSREVPAQDH
jgi:hypothetical protein